MAAVDLKPLTKENAPEESAKTLAGVEKKYGFIPNLYRFFAHAPGAIDGYLDLSKNFERGTLSATERNVVLLSASKVNGCNYCTAVHSTVADMQNDPEHIKQAIRNDEPIEDARLQALRMLTQALVGERGKVSSRVIQDFLDAGYQKAQVLEVLIGISMKTLSNYTNHLVDTPLDDAFKGNAVD